MTNRVETDPEMFETGKSIREAKLRQIRDKGRQEGRQEGRRDAIEFARTVLKEFGVSLPPEVAERLDRLYDGCDDHPPRNGFLRLIKRRSRC